MKFTFRKRPMLGFIPQGCKCVPKNGKPCTYYVYDEFIGDHYCKYLEEWGVKDKECKINTNNKGDTPREGIIYNTTHYGEMTKSSVVDDFTLDGIETF